MFYCIVAYTLPREFHTDYKFMQNNFFLLLAVALSIFLTNAFAQTTNQNIPKTISGGVLNGKATNLVKPAYPKEAKETRADGPVLIQVTIDEEGNVISASAVNGHPLLLPAGELAARASKFAPTKINNQPVRVNGVIVYNFVLTRSFLQIGYELALAEKTAMPEIFPSASIVGSLPGEWKEEKDEIYKLEAFSMENLANREKEESENAKQPQPTAKADENLNTGRLVSKALPINTYTFSLSSRSPKAVEILRNLQAKLENRLSPDEKRLWYFRIGRLMGSIVAEANETEKLRNNLAQYNGLINNAPASIPEVDIKSLKKIAEFSQSETLDTERKNQIVAIIKRFR